MNAVISLPGSGTRPDPVTVVNLSTCDELLYWVDPEQAVLCAHAQFPHGVAAQRDGRMIRLRDASTWEYRARYGHLLQRGRHTIACGDWCTLREDVQVRHVDAAA